MVRTPTSKNSHVALLHRVHPGAVASDLAKLVAFMGGSIESLALDPALEPQQEALKRAVSAAGSVIVDARVLSRQLRTLLLELSVPVLAYGFDDSPHCRELMKALAGGTVVKSAAGQRTEIGVAGHRDVCGPLSGLTFESTGAPIPLAFSPGDVTPLICAGPDPFFVRLTGCGGRWMLLAGEAFADLDAPVARGESILNHLPALAPVMMFLRASAPGAFWENEAPTACFIVDDPLLRARYGFLEFRKLFELMDEHRFSTSIAFIPWNHRRSDAAVAAEFLRRAGAASLSVHGCDHTHGEFAADDSAALAAKAQLALDRMEEHRERTGIGFDDVMVFPQGLFSKAAMPALQSCGYLAAINSTPYPVDGEQRLALRDLLGIAVTRFSGFPLFTRRYPRQMAELAFDLFLGRPAFVVEHHGYFQAGYEALASTVEKLGRLEPRLTWTHPGNACSRACWKRRGSDSTIHVQFATDRFTLENRSNQTQHFHLTRQGSAVRQARAAMSDGRIVEIERDAGDTPIRLELAAGQSACVQIARGTPERKAATAVAGLLYPVKVYLRRNLCEFRDNHIETSRLFGRLQEPAK